MPLIEHPTGNYRFLPGIAPYSCGVVSAPGYEIVHVTLQRPMPYRRGMEQIVEYLTARNRPKAALCGVELRSPRPFSFSGFSQFNAEYAKILESWGVFVNGMNPVARTHVAPQVGAPNEPSLYGFSFTLPSPAETDTTFVVAGGGELPEGFLERDKIVALGDTSATGIKTKAVFVMDLMENRLKGMGVGWSQINRVNVYTIHPIEPLQPKVLLERMGSAAIHGTMWYYSRPPIEEIEYEMDMRGTRTELVLD